MCFDLSKLGVKGDTILNYQYTGVQHVQRSTHVLRIRDPLQKHKLSHRMVENKKNWRLLLHVPGNY